MTTEGGRRCRTKKLGVSGEVRYNLWAESAQESLEQRGKYIGMIVNWEGRVGQTANENQVMG